MRKRNLILTVLVFALVLCASIQPAIAYFTTYVRAQGGYPVSLGDTTTITEEYGGGVKHVTIKNLEGSEPVFIRAKVIGTDTDEKATYTVISSDQTWTTKPDAEGYYYFGKSASDLTPVEGGKTTTPLDVEIKFPENPEEGDRFSVTVIYESTPVRYDAKGNPSANWNAKIIDVGSTTGGKG